MKLNCNSFLRIAALSSAAMIVLVFSSTQASALTWSITGESDIWINDTPLNWDGGTVAWSNGSTAVFSGTGENVTVTGAVSATSTSVGAGDGNWSFAGSVGNTIGGGTLTKTGTGTLSFTGTGYQNQFAGTVISQGGVTWTATSGGGKSQMGGGTIILNDISTGANNTSLLGLVSGGNLFQDINVTNNGVGVTTIGAGTATTGDVSYSATVTANKDLTLTSGGTGNARTNFSGPIAGSGNLTIATSGATTTRVVFNSSSAKTNTGNLTINAGARLQLSDGTAITASQIGDASLVTINGNGTGVDGSGNGMLRYAKGNGNSETIGGLAGAGTVDSAAGSGTFIIGSVASSFSGVIKNGSGTIGITKNGANTQTFSGTNTYSGLTTVSAGTLAINGDQFNATGNVTVSNAGTRLIGTGTIGGNTTINSGAIHSAGGEIANTDKVGLLTFGRPVGNTNLTLAADSIFEWDLSSKTDTDNGVRGTNYDAMDISGSLTVDSTTVFRVVLGSSATTGDLSFWQQTQTWSDIFGGGFSLVGTGFNNTLLQVVDASGSAFTPATLNPGYGFSISGTTLVWGPLGGPASGFDSWAAGKGLVGPDAAFAADPDNDGISNGLEFALGGEPNPANPSANSVALLPTVSQTSGNMSFTFKRKDLSEAGTALTFQWSTDLTFPSPANDIPVGAVSSTTDTITVDVTEDSPDTDTDTIVITVPAAKAAGGKLFGRLKAVKIP